MKQLAVLLILAIGCASVSKQQYEPGFTASASGFRFQNVIDVGDVEVEPMTAALQQFASLVEQGQTEVTLRIDSFGGSIFLGNAWIRGIEDLKKQGRVHVTCVVDGSAMSMGFVILQSPVCDVRLATKRSVLLAHNGSSGAKGTAEDLKAAAAFLEALNVAMALAVSERLGMPLEQYQSKIAHADWVMAIPEALSVHALDGVANPNEIAPPIT